MLKVAAKLLETKARTADRLRERLSKSLVEDCGFPLELLGRPPAFVFGGVSQFLESGDQFIPAGIARDTEGG